MPKGERAIYAHTAVDALRIMAPHWRGPVGDGPIELIDAVLGELGAEIRFAELAGERASRKVLDAGIAALTEYLPPRRRQGLDARLEWLIGVVEGSALDLEILAYLSRARLYEPYANIFGLFRDRGSGQGEVGLDALAALTGHSVYAVRKRLSAGHPLFDAGLAVDCGSDDWGIGTFTHRIALMRSTSPNSLSRNLLGRASNSPLSWEAFEHLGELGDLARKLVGEAASRAKGVNILLYGLPGTGKSEFARVLAHECGLHPVLVGETDDRGDEPERSERLAHLAVARSLVRHSKDHLLIVDEADDLMVRSDGIGRGSKFYLNHLIEKATAPTIWIVNEPDILGAAIIRRMNLAIRFDLPGRTVRSEIAKRIVAEEKVRLAPSELDAIADLKASPAVVRNALRAAAWTRGGAEVAITAANSIQEALSGQRTPSIKAPTVFDPKLSNASYDLEELTNQLKQSSLRNWSILAFGPPGTGKSALARHIAHSLGLETIEKRASDLLSMWVGQTEKGIAAAFREAADRGALLIIDEADSLLRTREGAQHSWEATMTNEMLTWMEAAQTPFFATTNLKMALDPATARRFSMSIEFLSLTNSQADDLYRRYFGAAAPAELSRIDDLTPGDFAQVAHRFSLLGRWSHARALTWLADLAEDRAGAAPMGFR